MFPIVHVVTSAAAAVLTSNARVKTAFENLVVALSAISISLSLAASAPTVPAIVTK